PPTSPPAPCTYTLSLHDALPISIRPVPSVLSISARNDEQLVRFTWRSKRFLRSLSPSRSANETSPMSSVSLWPLWKRPSQYVARSEEHTSELQSRVDLVCRLLLE